jgi:glutamine cyclotransferase
MELVAKLRVTLAALCIYAAVSSSFAAPPVYKVKVVHTYPHLTTSYTEGFFFRDGLFYEGTGLEGHSQILVYQPDGKLIQHYDVPAQYFGEGIIDRGDQLLEWTWQSHIGFVFDRTSLRPTGAEFHYTGEGWGMTRMGKEIVTSDGTPILRFHNQDTFDQTRQITVRDGMTPVRELNELEFVKGEIYANVWHSDRIARISPKDGQVLGWIDCTGLLPESQKKDAESVLNGIAYDAQKDRLFVTGKQWPTIFEIKLLPPTQPSLVRGK